MELHELAAVILVETPRTFFRLLLRTGRRCAEPPRARLLPCCALGSDTRRSVRIGTQIIVEIKQHRRAVGSRVEEVFEFAERMRLDHIALVRSHEPFHVAFPGEDVEMIEPEIVHDLLQLAVAIYGARDFGHREFFDDALRLAAVVCNGTRYRVRVDRQCAAFTTAPRGRVGLRRRVLHRPRGVRSVSGGDGGIARAGLCGRVVPLRARLARAHVLGYDRCGSVASRRRRLRLLLFEFLFFLFRLRIIRQKLLRRHPQRSIGVEAGFDGFVIDRIRVELLVDPLGKAHLPHAVNIAGTRAVSETVQGVQDSFVCGQLCDRQAFQNWILFGLFVARRNGSRGHVRRLSGQVRSERKNAGAGKQNR